MAEKESQKNENSFNSENIFDDFSDDVSIKKDIEKEKGNTKRDKYFYLKILNSFLFVINIIAIFSIVIFYLYVNIQNSLEKKEYSFLSPVCSFFLGSSDLVSNTCYGVTPLISEYSNNLKQEKENQSKRILPLLGDLYTIENFNTSKKVLFLLDRSLNRLEPVKIISDFDRIKQEYTGVDTSEISCFDILIRDGGFMSVTCDVYSSDWDREIVALNDGVKGFIPGGGTAVSRASSFMHFLENSLDSPFGIIEKPSVLSAVRVDLPPYTLKTTITMSLRYNDESSLPF